MNYIDNQPVCELMASKPDGIFLALDEELRMPKATDQTFVDKLLVTHKNNPLCKPVLKRKTNFIVVHYAGEVEYTTEGFLEKNGDRLLDDVAQVVRESSLPLLAGLFPTPKPDQDQKKKRSDTLAQKFCSQLDTLMQTLKATHPHYVRCIKPNSLKEPLKFEPVIVLQQLRYSGVFEAVQIRKLGFPFRHRFGEFARRYRCVIEDRTKVWSSDRAACEDMVKTMKQDGKVQFGATRVLYRSEQHNAMELVRNVAIDKTVTFIQKHVRGRQARQLRAALEHIKPILQDAVMNGSLASCEAALKQAETLRFPLFEWGELKKLKFYLTEENKLTVLLTRLLEQDPENVADELEKACLQADMIDLQSELAQSARARLAEIATRRKARAWLVEGTRELDERKLKWAVKKARDFKLANVGDALSNAQATLDRLENEKNLIASAAPLLAKGGYLNDGDDIDVSNIAMLHDEMEEYGMQTEKGRDCLRHVKLIATLREALKMALGSNNAELWDDVERVAKSAGDEFGDLPEVQRAVQECSTKSQDVDVVSKLGAAMSSFDHDTLGFLLAQCKELGISEDSNPQVAEARKLHSKLTKCLKMIAAGHKSVDQLKLEHAVFECESINFDSEKVQACRKLRDDIMQLNAEAQYAVEMLEEEQMKDVLDRATAVGLKTLDIAKLRQITELTPLKLVHEQLRVAVASGDSNRVVRLTILEKELFLADPNTLDMYQLKNFSKLRSPDAWASLKKLSMKKNKLADAMFKWTNKPIHASLSEGHSKQTKTAVRMFKNILGFTGDRAYASPFILAQELTRQCLEDEWLRDETYLQLIKQLTENPSAESRKKGWQLMAICLATFGSTPEFQTFLYVFLRSANTEEGGPNATRLLALMHATEFSFKPRTEPYPEAELVAIAEGKAGGRRYWTHKRDYVVPKPKPLLDKGGVEAEPLLEVLYSYQASRPNQLSIKKGERIYLLSDSQDGRRGWWEARNKKGDIGLVAVNYVKRVEDDDTAAEKGPAPNPARRDSKLVTARRESKFVTPSKPDSRPSSASAAEKKDSLGGLGDASARSFGAGGQRGSVMMSASRDKRSSTVSSLEPTRGRSRTVNTPQPAQKKRPAKKARVTSLKCLYKYAGSSANQLSFAKGDELTLLSDIEEGRQGWWLAEDKGGKRGLIPKNYVKKQEQDPAPEDEEADVEASKTDQAAMLQRLQSKNKEAMLTSPSAQARKASPPKKPDPEPKRDTFADDEAIMQSLLAAVDGGDEGEIRAALVKAEKVKPTPDRTATIQMVKEFIGQGV